MNKWVKLSELPNHFWAECFVSIYDGKQIFTEINWVKKTTKEVFWHSDSEKEWFEFRSDRAVKVLVYPVEYPEVAEDSFK